MDPKGVDAVARLCGLTREETIAYGLSDVLHAAAELSRLPEDDPQVWMLAGTAVLYRAQCAALSVLAVRMEQAASAAAQAVRTLEVRERELFDHIAREKEAWDREGMTAAINMLRTLSKDREVSREPRKGFFGFFGF